MAEKKKKTRKHIFGVEDTEKKLMPKQKRGQKNAKHGRNHYKSDTPGGLMGHAEDLIGHKKAGQSHKNVERKYR